MLCQKRFFPANKDLEFDKKRLSPKKFWVQKNSGSKKKNGSKKILGPK